MKRKILIPVLVVMLATVLAAPLAAGRKHPSKLKYPDLEVTKILYPNQVVLILYL